MDARNVTNMNRDEVIALVHAFKTEIDSRFSWYRSGSDYTFAHIVIADYNLSDANIDFCFEQRNIELWDQYYRGDYQEFLDGKDVWAEDYAQLKAEITAFLQFLKTIPEYQRNGLQERD